MRHKRVWIGFSLSRAMFAQFKKGAGIMSRNCNRPSALLSVAVCGFAFLVAGSPASADDYRVYSYFNPPGTYLTWAAGGYVQDYGVPGTWGDEIQYIYCIDINSYGGPRTAYKIRVWVTNEGSAADPTSYIDIDQHPDHPNPDHVGPIEPRHFEIVATADVTAYSENGGWAMEEFHVDATGVYLGADPYGVQKFDHDLNYIGQITPAAPGAGQSMAYDPGREIWFAGDNARNIYQISDTDSDGDYMDETWEYIFTYPNMAGSHHDGMEYVGGYLWISDMTSDVLAKWEYDSSADTWSEVARYTYSESAVVEGMGYGPNASFWIGGYGSSYVYELHGEISQCYPVADAGEDVPSYPPTIPITLDGSGSYFEAGPTCPEGEIVLYEWDCESDGIYDYSGADPATTCTYPAVYNPDGSIDWAATAHTYTATLRVTDNTPPSEGGPLTSVDTCEVNITAPPWRPVADPNGPYNPRVNHEVCLDGSGSYHPAAAMYEPDHPWYDNIVSWEWDLDDDGAYDATGESVCHTWTTAGTYVVCLRVTDGAGETDVKCTMVIVAPGIHDLAVEDLTPSQTTEIPVGEVVTIYVNVPNLGDYVESFFDVTAYIDGVEIDGETVPELGVGCDTDLVFYWDTTGFEEATYTIMVCVDVVPGEFLADNNCQEVTVSVVENRAPTADPNGPYLGPLETCFDGTGSSDPDGDPLTYSWDFGDGNTGTGATPCYTYAGAGIYDICLVVNDGHVDSLEACTKAVIYDPNDGFVTGGGWIESPVGAYTPDPSLIGKANFGFVSKYKKHSDVPEGQTEFQFHVADLNFHSSGYEWLVVTGSNYAMFKGSGTINGEGDYRFRIWAGDDDPDTFRIKIWLEDEITGVETVVYDNGFDQEIAGGSIKIHTK